MPRPRRSDAFEPGAARASVALPRWSVVLRALREACGASQEGWAAQLGFGRSTIQRWESGDLPPGPEAEAALLRVCGEKRLFRTFYQGPLRGQTLTDQLVSSLLSDARLDASQDRPKRLVAAVPVRAEAHQPRRRADLLDLPHTSFVGRALDLTEVQALLARTRLVSVTGPAGAGKTRLALHVANAAAPQFPDGIRLVDLSAIDTADRLPLALATALGLHEDGNEPSLSAAIRRLGLAQSLLVFDNCEHVLEACARLVDRLLTECPTLHVLATTRQPLRLTREVCWPIGGLNLPPPGADMRALEQLAASAAVQLFVDRASAAQAGFRLTADNAPAVVRICEKLDGLPLGIELAAAHTQVLAPAQLASKLDNHLRLLPTSSISLPPRHQTLHAALEWSYEPLPEAERSLLRRLAVFAGGWSLEAAEGIAGAPRGGHDILDVLSNLVSRSLVVADLGAGQARYWLLQTVRRYASEKLQSAAEERAARDAHLNWFLLLAESAEPHLRGPEQVTWLGQLEEEIENFRAALSWAFSGGKSAVDGLRIAAALRWFWLTRARAAEGRGWLARGLAAADSVNAALRAKALDSAAAMAQSEGAYSEAHDFQLAALELWRAEGDLRQIAAAQSTLGILAKARGEHDRVEALLEEALANARLAEDDLTEATVLEDAASLALNVGEYSRGGIFLERSLGIYRRLGDTAGAARSLLNLGEAVFRQGDDAGAVDLLSESLALFHRIGANHSAAQTLRSLGTVALQRADTDAAGTQFTRARELFKMAGDERGQALCVEKLAEVAQRTGDNLRAARLLGAADAWRENNAAPIAPNEREAYERVLKAVRVEMDRTTFTRSWAEGRTLGLAIDG